MLRPTLVISSLFGAAAALLACESGDCQTSSDCAGASVCSLGRCVEKEATFRPGGPATTDGGTPGGSPTGGGPFGACGGPITFASIEVYLMGTLAEGAGMYAAAHWSTPNAYATGFPTDRDMFIRPTDGALLYMDRGAGGSVVRVHTYDPETYERDRDACVYPRDVTANDAPLPVPPSCSLNDFRVHPDDGRVVYRCGGGTTAPHAYEDGTLVPKSDQYPDVFPGFQGRYLGEGFSLSRFAVVDSSGVESPVSGVPQNSRLMSVRAQPDGFWIALRVELGGTGSTSIGRQLWMVGFDGSATKLADYGAVPADVNERDTGAWPKLLDGEGNLYLFGDSVSGPSELILRFERGGSPGEIVYDEEAGAPDEQRPRVRMHGSFMFSASWSAWIG